MMKPKTYLFTANADLAAPFLSRVEKLNNVRLLHLPLEHVEPEVIGEEEDKILDYLSDFTFVIYGNLRNARYFLRWAGDRDVLGLLREKIHLCMQKSVADLLDRFEIPGIMPRDDARPIDIVEFMLRISREGHVLYPSEEQKGEELPGLLQELEIPVAEFTVCSEVPVPQRNLLKYRKELSENTPDAVLFHSRSAVTRTLAAFPDLDLSEMELVSSGHAVTAKLEEEGLKPDSEARSTWRSLLKELGD